MGSERETHHLPPEWVSPAFAGVNLLSGYGCAFYRDRLLAGT